MYIYFEAALHTIPTRRMCVNFFTNRSSQLEILKGQCSMVFMQLVPKSNAINSALEIETISLISV